MTLVARPKIALDWQYVRTVCAFQSWLQTRPRGRRLSPRSADKYAYHVRRALSAYRSPVESLRWSCQHLWPTSVPPGQAALLAWAEFTADEALTCALREVRLPEQHGRKTPRYPIPKLDFARLWEAIEGVPDPVLRNILAIQVRTGQRCVDVLRIERGAITVAAGDGPDRGVLVYQGKGDVRHRVPVAKRGGEDFIWSYLRRLYDARNGKWTVLTDLVTRSKSPTREAVAASHLRRALKVACESASLPYGVNADGGIYPHRSRRTVAVAVLRRSGNDPTVVKKVMGWRSDRTVAAYLDHPEDARVGDLLTGADPRQP